MFHYTNAYLYEIQGLRVTEILESQTETQVEVSLRYLHQHSTFLDQNLAHSLCMKSLLGIWSRDQKHMEAPESSSYPSNFLEMSYLLILEHKYYYFKWLDKENNVSEKKSRGKTHDPMIK